MSENTETPQAGCSEYEGKVFTPSSQKELIDVICIAFDYRGDITLKLNDNTEHSGFLYNYDIPSDKVFLFIPTDKRNSSSVSFPLSSISAIAFTGADTAFGKSWDTWQSKSKKQREAEAIRIENEAKARGDL